MTDVRLTATNPEDSSVVPVACNDRGELLLEEPTLASDNYVAVTGDNMTGDLTLGTNVITLDATDGDASFGSGDVQIINNDRIFVSRSLPDGLVFGSSPTSTLSTYYKELEIRANKSLGTYANKTIFRISANNTSGAGDGPEIQLKTLLGHHSGGSINLVSTTLNGSTCSVVRVGESRLTGYAGSTTDPDDIDFDKPGWFIRDNGNAEFGGDVVVTSRNKQWMLVEQNGLCHMVEQMRATTADLVDPATAPAAAEYPPLRDVFAELDAIEKALEEVMDKLRMAPPAGWEVWDGSSENS